MPDEIISCVASFPVRADAVIFDLDGTLFDHRGAARTAVTSWLSWIRETPTELAVARWFAAEERFIAAWHRGELDWHGQRRARVRDVLDALGREAVDDPAADELFAAYLRGYERAWRAFDDARPALRRIAEARLPVAVLTNGSDEQQRAKVAACGLADLVGGVFSSDVIGVAKPDPLAYRYVCDQLDVAPGRVLHVGDRHDLDVVAARAAGLDAIHLDRDRTGPADEASRIVSLAELPDRLGL